MCFPAPDPYGPFLIGEGPVCIVYDVLGLLVLTTLIFSNTYLHLLNKCPSGVGPGVGTALPSLKQFHRPEAFLS